MEIIENPATFYKLLFNEELYTIKEPKKYPDTRPVPQNIVSETEDGYVSAGLNFEGPATHTLILLHYAATTDIPEAEKLFLDQVLRAAGMGFNAVSRLNTAGLDNSVGWETIAAQNTADYVISFGVPARLMPGGIEEGQIYNINGKRALCSGPLKDIAANNMRKKLLWQGMKEIYGI